MLVDQAASDSEQHDAVENLERSDTEESEHSERDASHTLYLHRVSQHSQHDHAQRQWDEPHPPRHQVRVICERLQHRTIVYLKQR